VALKKSDLYSSLWKSCDELRRSMDASQYKDYILTLLFVKYVSDKAKADADSLIDVPAGGCFDDVLAKKHPDCLEYILVHEMAHYLERNHGERCKKLMDGFMPDWRRRRDQLNGSPLADERWAGA
jgi:Protein of unknown function DUF45/HsdM N-terminal domain